MKKLILTRGTPSSGKSTFIERLGLQQYTLSPDVLRLQFQSPELTDSGIWNISNKNDKRVWKNLFDILEIRMQRGDFTIIDATHSRTKDFNAYKQLADEYRYQVICVDFSFISAEQAKEWNRNRTEHKRVPDESIDIVRNRIDSSPIPSWVTVVQPNTFVSTVSIQPLDFSHYKKIHMIGDVHGCYNALRSYLPFELPDDECFIFVGDYVDRGIQNGEVMNFLFTLMFRKNVIFLEGNHEIHLWKYANDLPSYSKKEFERFTKRDLDKSGVSKKTLREFYRRLRQLAYFTYEEKEILVTHGGLSSIPTGLVLVSTEQLIKGVGDYSTEIDRIFSSLAGEDQYQVHGHRNIHEFPIEAAPRSFNLEGKIEMGGHLRVVTLDKDGFTPIEVKNDVVSERFLLKQNHKEFNNHDFLKTLRKDDLVYEKILGENISSFNFKREVFFESLWDEKNVKARGLFINTDTTEIIARSYEKFFNIDSYLNDDEDRKLF